MAATDYEISASSGQPINLFEFTRNSGGVDYFWRYNGSDRSLWWGGVEWKAVPIKHDGIQLSGEAQSTTLMVTMPIAEQFCEQFRLSGTVPTETVWLRVRRTHVGDIADIDGDMPAVVGDPLVQWIGTVSGITQINEVEAKVTCAMLAASFQRGGLRYGYQRNCPHVLYAPNTCKVDREVFRVNATVTGITGLTIAATELATQPDGWFDGGFIEYTQPGGIIERRMVLVHFDNFIEIAGLPSGLSIGGVIAAFPGCDRTVDTCISKFNNLLNMGGFPHTPGRNPFDGQPLF